MADTLSRGYLICIKSNGERGSSFPITCDYCYIGSSVECEIRLLDVNIIDRHCLIKSTHSKNVTIHCLCPEYPVLLNDESVSEAGSLLKTSDIIQILDVKFKWEENDSFVGTTSGRFSVEVEKKSSTETEPKRFSEPVQIFSQKSIIEDKRENETQLNCNNINHDEQKTEKVTSETTPATKSSVSSPSVEAVMPSIEIDRSNYNCDAQNQSGNNNSSKDLGQVRRSRQFCPTYKVKSSSNTPENKKTPAIAKSFFANSPLQENNHSRGKEVKSRFFGSRNSSTKLATTLPITEKSFLLENEKKDSKQMVNCVHLDTEVENIVPGKETHVESKENTFGNELNAEEATFDTTVLNDTIDPPSALTTPKCFNKAFHSTPKAPELKEFDSNLEADDTTTASNAVYRPNDPTQIYSLDNNSILASPVKSLSQSDSFFKKKADLENSRPEQDSMNETRRHHTRSTSNILKRTFEECSEDSLPVGEKSLTTPEKSTNECSSHSKNPAVIVEESELDSYSPEKKVDSRKSVSGSIRSPMLESTSEVSADNSGAVSSSSLDIRDKSLKHDDSSMMAKCSRNLSLSPPENNRSQEYMDSVIVSTPKKPSLVENEEMSLSALVTAVKDSAMDGAGLLTPDTHHSPSRHRRSTGIVPFVGTPSDVYRTTKGGLTPAHKSRFNRTSMEVEVSIGPRDSLSSLGTSKFGPKRSSERKSTPLKTEKITPRDSLQMQSTIVEEYALECEESQNESLNNDSQFKFVSKRRRRLAKSSFAIEDRILEESEINTSDLSNDEDELIDEEESLVPLESFDENSEFASTRIVVNQTPDTEDDLNSTYNIETPEEVADESKEMPTPSTRPILPKSILTPMPRQPISVREKSAKKVTFFDVKEDSLTDVSACVAADADSEFDLQLSNSRANSTTDYSCGENTSHLPKNDSDDERLYLSDKSSEACSFNTSTEKGSVVRKILAKRDKIVKRLSSGKEGKSPRLSGLRRLLNPAKSPKCNYSNVSGMEQLLKTPESLVKSVEKSSSVGKGAMVPETLTVSSPEPSNTVETPESHPKSSKSIATRQKTPASFGKRAKPQAECLSTPKALMAPAEPPEIVVEFVETPKDASLPKNEELGNVSATRKKSIADDADSSFATPTVRRCSKHFRIHRNSVCLSLASSLNSSLTETLSAHDCSASLESSIAEQKSDQNEVVPVEEDPKIVFATVLEELQVKLRALQEKRGEADKDLLETSINAINEVLVDELAPDSDVGVAEESLEKVLLNLSKRFSYLEKVDGQNESSVKPTSEQSSVAAIDNEPSISSQLGDEESKDVANDDASEKISESSIDASKCDAISSQVHDSKPEEVGSSVAEITDSEEVSSNDSVMKESEEVRNTVSDAVEILSNVCNEAEIGGVNIVSISTAEESSDTFAALKPDEAQDDVSCPNASENVNSTFDKADIEELQESIPSQTNSSNSVDSKCENVLGAVDTISVEASHSTAEFEAQSPLSIDKETTVESLESQSHDSSVEDKQPVSILDEKQQSQNTFVIETSEEKEPAQTNISIPIMSEKLSKSIIEADEPESDSQGLELFVSDSDEVIRPEQKSTVVEKSDDETATDVTSTPIEAAENAVGDSTDLLEVATAKSSFLENQEPDLKTPTTASSEIPPGETVPRKSSCVDNSAVSNDTFKTYTSITNLTSTAADIEKDEKSPVILDALISNEKSKRFFDVSASLLVHEENKENLLLLSPIAVGIKENSILLPPASEKEKTPSSTATTESDVSEIQPPEAVSDTPEIPNCVESSVSAEGDAKENIVTSEKPVIPEKSVSTEEANISLNSYSYPSDPELDTTCEENLSCVEESITEAETDAEANTTVTEESRTTITSCEVYEGKTTDASADVCDSSQTSVESSVMPASSESCSTAESTELSSPVSENVTMALVAPGPSNLDAQAMVTPPRSTAVCVSIETEDQLLLAGAKIVTQKVKSIASRISTSTPLNIDVTQQLMEIPPSCSTTIDANVSPSEDELESDSKIDDEATVAPPENEEKEPVDVTKKNIVESSVEIPVQRSSRNFSVVLENAKTDLLPIESSSRTHSTSLETAKKNAVVPESSTSVKNIDNETESVRPKRGRPTTRYTESKGGSSTQSRRAKTTPNEASSHVMDLSIDLPRLEVPQEKNTVGGTKRKTVHFDVEPQTKRATRSRDLGKVHVPTPKKSRTKSKVKAAENSNTSPPASDLVHQFGSPCSIILRKMERDPENSSVTWKVEPKRATRSRSVAPKEKVPIRTPGVTNSVDESAEAPVPKRPTRGRCAAPKEKVPVRPSRATTVNNSADNLVEETKRGKKAKKVEEPVENEADCEPLPKKNAKANKNAVKINESESSEVAGPSKERPKKKVAEAAKEKKAEHTGSSQSVSKGKSKTEPSETVEGSEEAPSGERRSKRKTAEVEKVAVKGKKAASQNKVEKENSKLAGDTKSEVPAKEEKRSRRKVVKDVEAKKPEDVKASKRAKGKVDTKEPEPVDDSSSGSRAARQKKAAPSAEPVEPPKTSKRAKVETSSESAPRPVRSRKEAAESSKSSKIIDPPETTKSKATKRTASVLDSTEEVVSKKRKQAPVAVSSPAVTRNKKKKIEIPVVSNVKVTLKRQKVDEKENKPVNTREAADEKPVTSAANKKKRDPSTSADVKNTRAAKVKSAPTKETNDGTAASTSRVTRNQIAGILPRTRVKK